MKEKRDYEHPLLDVIKFEIDDIVTASGNDIGEDNGENDGEWI